MPVPANWKVPKGMARLQNLTPTYQPDQEASPPEETGPDLDMKDPLPDYVEQVRNRAIENIDPEVMREREQIWDSAPHCSSIAIDDAPDWFTLDPHDDFGHWASYLMDELGCDDRSIEPFSEPC